MNSETKVKQHPILFSTPMVQAILEGRKTMTRRIINPQPALSVDNCSDRAKIVNALTGTDDSLFYFWKHFPLPSFPENTEHLLKYCPYGQAGDVLWCRETFWSGYKLDENDAILDDDPLIYSFYADDPFPRPFDMSDSRCTYLFGHDKRDWPRWKPSIHMPYDACRLFLKITDIRVERLQDVTEEDARKEGVIQNRDGSWHDYIEPKRLYQDDARASFISLWQSINGVESWQSNPWVWCVSFKRIEKPAQ